MSSAATATSRPPRIRYLPSPTPSSNCNSLQKLIPPPLSLKQVQQRSLAEEAALHKGGLRTPPSEAIMSVVYHRTINAGLSCTYDSPVIMTSQSSGGSQASRVGEAFCEMALKQIPRDKASQSQPQYAQLPQFSSHHCPSQTPQISQPRYQSNERSHPHLQSLPQPQPQPQVQVQSQSQPQPQQNQNQQRTQQLQPPSQTNSRHHHSVSSSSTIVPPSQTSQSVSRTSTRPSTPGSAAISQASSEGTVSKKESTMVTHNLRLPACISENGGNLDEFAALMTCFFWFEDMATLRTAEKFQNAQDAASAVPLKPETRPCPAYRKWVNSILSTTQVTQNVILLALLFVYRLKSSNPKVNGHHGSEYRLLTVALMLGNKFLDDNTYTNKTWAEVSGISVKEIHVMEVEFLSNMRYGLLTSAEEWQEWLNKLAAFHQYCEDARLTEQAAAERVAAEKLAAQHRAMAERVAAEKSAAEAAAAEREKSARIASLRRVSIVPQIASSPCHRYGSPLPSPTSILPSNMQSPPLTTYSPIPRYSSNSNWHVPQQPGSNISPTGSQPTIAYPTSRKRSLEVVDLTESAPKRISQQPPVSLPPVSRHLRTTASTECQRVSIPALTLDTAQPVPPHSPYPPSISSSQAHVSLPPLGPTVRAMAAVYPNPSSWTSQGSVPSTCGSLTPSFTTTAAVFGTPSKYSPGRMGTYGSSSTAEGYQTPMSNSPSVYLQHRNSPYKPVRPVNTLNNPPPSIPLSEYHYSSAQMRYQPLGRRNLHTGIVPEFIGGRSTLVNTPGHHY